MGSILLNDSQRRSLQASLLTFEKSLRKADRILSHGDEFGILYYRTSKLGIQRRRLIQKKIAQTIKEVADFAHILGLESSEESAEGVIRAEMSLSWENLEECKSKKLRGYGDIDPLAAAMLDPTVDYFAKTALELSNMVSLDLSEDHSIEE